jgi:glycosyltransferase involved in cell wall biosynthesis
MTGKINNILIMANYSNRTGFAWNNIYRLFQYLAANFREMNITPYISFPDIQQPVEEPYFKDFEEFLRLQPKPTSLAELKKLRSAIKKHKIDAIYLTDHNHYSALYLLYRLWGVKKIIVHNRISVASPDDPPREFSVKAAIKFFLARIPFISCDRTYAVSDFVKRRLVNKAKVRSDEVKVILNGIDTNLFKPSSPKDSEITRIYTEAASILVNKRNIKDFVIDYAGDGPDIEYLRALVNDANIATQINFLGETKGTSELQKRADIIVVPSAWGDACPSAVSEALASGKPLVATIAGGIPEMVGSPNNAVLIPHSNSEAIADALQQLLSDSALVQRLSSAARQRAIEALDIKRYHQDVFNAMLEDLQLVKQDY